MSEALGAVQLDRKEGTARAVAFKDDFLAEKIVLAALDCRFTIAFMSPWPSNSEPAC